MSIPSLDQIVLQSLEFFSKNLPPTLDLSRFELPFVIGSGNAINTGKILFSDKAAIFADESNFRSQVQAYKQVINKGLIRDAVIISASGEKDSVWEIELAKQSKLKTTLLTCKPQSSAAKLSDSVLAYKSISEPYTYNTSTYLGMILSVTKEDPKFITNILTKLAKPSNFENYESYAFVLPDRFLNVTPMILIKDDELFGPHLQIRAYTEGHARHAKFVHPWEKELVISIGVNNTYYGDSNHRWNIDIGSNESFGAMLSITYYICGLIQSAKPSYFEKDIEAYCKDFGPKAYGKNEPFEVIVPANN